MLHLADPRRAGSSEFKGVCLKKGRWISQICIEGTQVYLGSFETELEAARKFAAASKKNGIVFGHGVLADNFDVKNRDKNGRLIR